MRTEKRAESSALARDEGERGKENRMRKQKHACRYSANEAECRRRKVSGREKREGEDVRVRK